MSYRALVVCDSIRDVPAIMEPYRHWTPVDPLRCEASLVAVPSGRTLVQMAEALKIPVSDIDKHRRWPVVSSVEEALATPALREYEQFEIEGRMYSWANPIGSFRSYRLDDTREMYFIGEYVQLAVARVGEINWPKWREMRHTAYAERRGRARALFGRAGVSDELLVRFAEESTAMHPMEFLKKWSFLGPEKILPLTSLGEDLLWAALTEAELEEIVSGAFCLCDHVYHAGGRYVPARRTAEGVLESCESILPFFRRVRSFFETLGPEKLLVQLLVE